MTQDSPVSAETSPLNAHAAGLPEPDLGDVIDALDDAAATLKRVVLNRAESKLSEVRRFVNDKPLMSITLAVSVAYLMGRLHR